MAIQTLFGSVPQEPNLLERLDVHAEDVAGVFEEEQIVSELLRLG